MHIAQSLVVFFSFLGYWHGHILWEGSTYETNVKKGHNLWPSALHSSNSLWPFRALGARLLVHASWLPLSLVKVSSVIMFAPRDTFFLAWLSLLFQQTPSYLPPLQRFLPTTPPGLFHLEESTTKYDQPIIRDAKIWTYNKRTTRDYQNKERIDIYRVFVIFCFQP